MGYSIIEEKQVKTVYNLCADDEGDFIKGYKINTRIEN